MFVTYPLNFRDLTCTMGPNKLIHARRRGEGVRVSLRKESQILYSNYPSIKNN